MTPSELQCRFAGMMAALIIEARTAGWDVKVTELYRDLATQQDYVKRGLSKTLDSMHLKGLAVDLCLFKNGKADWTPETYKPLGDYWKTLDPKARWGGDFGAVGSKIGWDPVHFELRP